MILALDIGNTNMTLGGFEEDRLVFVSRFSTHRSKTQDEVAIIVLEALRLHGVSASRVRGAAVSSVVPPLNAAVRGAIRFLFGFEAVFVGPGIKSGIRICCDHPASVGSDLICAAVAAHSLYGENALIVDLGTATKMTVVDEKGAFLGTSIIPGVQMGLDALAEHAAQLPRIGLELPKSVIGKNTADCMRSGVVFGAAAMIDGMILRICEEFGSPLRVIATGGLSSLIVPLCKSEISVEENLVLVGLKLLYHKNTGEP